MTAFDAAFGDTTKPQQAHIALQQLQMRDDDLDSYVATFKSLAEDAGYDLANLGTVHIFAAGLKKGLRSAILHRDTQPTTFDEWVTQAQSEMQKFARRKAFEDKNYAQYAWAIPKRGNGHCEERRHPNDIPVPMDVDLPIYTRVRRAYTEDDKNRFKKEGRCFYCDQQGHMARECPKKKHQFGQDRYRSNQNRDKPFPQFKKKPSKPKYMGQGFRKKNQFNYKPIRTAYIEDDQEEEEEEEEEETYVESLAARTAKLSDNQREQWVEEMCSKGINF